jgi:hypothetical protein
MSIFETWPHQWFGWFRDSVDDWGQVPLFSEVVDETWNPSDLNELADYLKNCPIGLVTSARAVNCGMCGEDLGNPSVQRTDQVWIWPESLEHFVRKHHARLPDAMVNHMRARDYQVPNS